MADMTPFLSRADESTHDTVARCLDTLSPRRWANIERYRVPYVPRSLMPAPTPTRTPTRAAVSAAIAAAQARAQTRAQMRMQAQTQAQVQAQPVPVQAQVPTETCDLEAEALRWEKIQHAREIAWSEYEADVAASTGADDVWHEMADAHACALPGAVFAAPASAGAVRRLSIASSTSTSPCRSMSASPCAPPCYDDAPIDGSNFDDASFDWNAYISYNTRA